MEYEFRVWNDSKKDLSKDQTFKPETARNWLQATADSVKDVLGNNDHGNPDILIDTKTLGEGTVALADISYSNEKIKDQNNETTKRAIKMHIKGNLYLPLDGDLADAVKEAANNILGAADSLKAKRNTLLLSQWAAVDQDSKDANNPYYRSVALSITTKAGDFRIITANKMYVENYREDYSEGEFGIFELMLKQSLEPDSMFKVDGLASEKLTVIDKIGKAIEKAASVTSKIAATVAVAGAVVTATTETVEKFTGETDATRKIKGVSKATVSAGKVVKNTGELAKSARSKDFDKILGDVKNLSDSGNDLVQNSNDAHINAAMSIEQMEKMYGDVIMKDPERYEKYLKSSPSEKRKALEEAAQQKIASVKATKAMEEAVKNEKELTANKKELANLEKEYLILIKNNPEAFDKYSKATVAEKLEMIKEKKEEFDDMQNKYLDLIKKDPKKFEEYNKADTATQLKMLEEAKAASENTNPDDTSPENSKPDDTSPKDSKPDDTSPENSKPDETPPKTKSPKNKSARNRGATNSTADNQNNVSLSGADINDMLSEAVNKKNGNSQ